MPGIINGLSELINFRDFRDTAEGYGKEQFGEALRAMGWDVESMESGQQRAEDEVDLYMEQVTGAAAGRHNIEVEDIDDAEEARAEFLEYFERGWDSELRRLKEMKDYAFRAAYVAAQASYTANADGDYADEKQSFLDKAWERDENVDNDLWDALDLSFDNGWGQGWDDARDGAEQDAEIDAAAVYAALEEAYS